MARPLIDLLWRDHPAAPSGGARGPRARVTTGAVVDAAIGIADAGGLGEVTVRRLGDKLDVSAMSVYTHVNSRDDLLVLMADTTCARMEVPRYGRAGWRTRVRRVADAELALYRAHPWLLEVTDQRTALGPGTIARYDHELHAFDPLPLDDVTRDAALTFVLDFVRAAARAQLPDPRAEELARLWAEVGSRLEAYVGADFPLAARVGSAAGEAMQAAYSSDHAWRFGLDRVLDGLAALTRHD
jgi:AcrR family transcriptional regulator